MPSDGGVFGDALESEASQFAFAIPSIRGRGVSSEEIADTDEVTFLQPVVANSDFFVCEEYYLRFGYISPFASVLEFVEHIAKRVRIRFFAGKFPLQVVQHVPNIVYFVLC
ncbi:hypothetical protein Ga0100231_005105 [Opitutaceae bacterium TAV4]|nr:hypothetical protein Ga0100231_005105 [Opitutaceae bacterium TAV4]RRK00906.1 hypothetical protein Ga0100230_024350 [Opitutaceae bacterium TAV3]